MGLDHAWAAGFIDGEGYISLRRAATSYAPLIVVSQASDRTSLDKLVRTLGGTVRMATRRTATGREVNIWNWQSAAQMRRHLPLLIEHMTVKRPQAELLLEYVNRMSVRSKGSALRPLNPAALAWRENVHAQLAALRKGSD